MWEATSAKGYDITDGTRDDWNEVYGEDPSGDFFERVRFSEEGVLTLYYLSGIDKTWKKAGSKDYSIKGNKINFKDEDGDTWSETIVSLTPTQLIVKSHDKWIEKGAEYEFYNVVTYKKIN